MPTLTVNLALDAPGSGAELDDDTVITVQALNDVVRTVDTVTYTIEPWLAEGYYWVHHPWGSKLVHLTADAALHELAAIDPATLDAEAPLTPAWEEALALRPILIRLTQAEYDALTPAEQADPLKLYVIPAI